MKRFPDHLAAEQAKNAAGEPIVQTAEVFNKSFAKRPPRSGHAVPEQVKMPAQAQRVPIGMTV